MKHSWISIGVLAVLATLSGWAIYQPRVQRYILETWGARPERVSGRRQRTYPPLDAADYDRRVRRLGESNPGPYPKAGALLPFHRIVAFYGNFHSKQMGILGEFPEAEVLQRLRSEAAHWRTADPQTPVLPALHYIAVTAQGTPGADGAYRLRMPQKELRTILAMSHKVGAIVIFDVQVGRSQVLSEVAQLDRFLKLPNVHLGLDPEFAMQGNAKPGHTIGSLDAAVINRTIAHLSNIVEENGLPPKILIVHRFVKDMVTHASLIRPTPQVQVVMDMDGWGAPSHKQTTYRLCVTREPVQFSGFKLFYKNDRREPGSRLMTPQEVLQLTPQPIYIQYQ